MDSGKLNNDSNKPLCFGDLQRVLPPNEGIIRGPNYECQACSYLKDCLKIALKSKHGKEWQLSRLEELQCMDDGVLGFIKRWSRLKMLK